MTALAELLPSANGPARPDAASLCVHGECVYLSPDADKPTVAPLAFERALHTAEQPYIRWLTVGSEWKPLDFGWLAESGASFLVLANDAPTFATIPSQEERMVAMAKVVEVYFAPPVSDEPRTMFSAKVDRTPFAALLVPPGEQLPVTPGEGSILVRCRSGSTRCTLTLFPR